MCNCITEIETQLAERAALHYYTPDISDHRASLEGVSFSFSDDGKNHIVTQNEVIISFLKKGKNVNKKVVVHHTFCPFCAEKYEKEVNDGQ